jgi:uncharacterized protein (TIGR02466 family)
MGIMTPSAQRFQKADVLRMFPTFLWKAELRPEIYEPLNDSILQALGALRAPLDGLVSGESWQSDHGLQERDEFQGLAACIQEAAESALDYLKVARQSVRITGCWANLNAPGAGHRQHNHPNNFLSGVYYVRTQAGADNIGFLDPRPQTAIIRPPVTELTVENTEQVVVSVKDGLLLLFPAWLLHAVDPNRSNRIRVSIGFNLMFPAYAERMTRPSWVPGKRPSV